MGTPTKTNETQGPPPTGGSGARPNPSKIDHNQFTICGRFLHLVGYTIDVANRFKEESEKTSTPLNFREALELAVLFMRGRE